MAKKEEKQVIENKVQELPPRIHIREFLFSTDLDALKQAGFLAFVQGKEWMRLLEWKEQLDKYNSR